MLTLNMISISTRRAARRRCRSTTAASPPIPGGGGTKALTFTYTVANGENTPDLTVTAVNLNGAPALDANGHDAVFTGAIGNPPGTLQIDPRRRSSWTSPYHCSALA